MSFDIKALWREPSTKRGVVMFVTGGVVLYQTFFGSDGVDIAVMESRIERWIGMGMMVAGLLGWLPDLPKEKRNEFDQSDHNDQLKKIELVERSESDAAKRDVDAENRKMLDSDRFPTHLVVDTDRVTNEFNAAPFYKNIFASPVYHDDHCSDVERVWYEMQSDRESESKDGWNG